MDRKKASISSGNPKRVKRPTARLLHFDFLGKSAEISPERLLFLAGFTREEGIVLELDNLPRQVKLFLVEHGYDYLVVTKEAYKQGITPELLSMLVELAAKLRNG